MIVRIIGIIALTIGVGVFLGGTIATYANPIELRAVVFQADSAAEIIKSRDGSKVFGLKKSPILTNKDFQQARVSGQGDRAVLDLELTPAGKERLARFSRKNQGKPLAIVFDERVWMAPVIRAVLDQGKVRLTYLPKGEAQKLAREINQR